MTTPASIERGIFGFQCGLLLSLAVGTILNPNSFGVICLGIVGGLAIYAHDRAKKAEDLDWAYFNATKDWFQSHYGDKARKETP